MKYKFTVFLMFFILFVSSYSEKYMEIFKGRVISVADGDTLTVKAKEKKIRVRLFGVDSPEKKQEHGKEARNFTVLMLYNKVVEVKVVSIDQYGRVVGDIFLEDGRSFNHEIVKNGYAWWYSYFAPNNKELKELEYVARSKKIGLWKSNNPEAPWKYRKRNKFE